MPHHEDRSRPPHYPRMKGAPLTMRHDNIRAGDPPWRKAENDNPGDEPPPSPRRKRLVAFAEMSIDIAGLVILTGVFLGGCVLFVRALVAIA